MGWGGEDVNSILNTSFFINCSFLGDFYAENIIEKRKEKKKKNGQVMNKFQMRLWKEIYLLEFWVTKTNGFRADKKAHSPSGFEEFVQFQEVFGSGFRNKYETCQSCAITFSLCIFPSQKHLFSVLHCDSCFPYRDK